jgi:hypothetical protein
MDLQRSLNNMRYEDSRYLMRSSSIPEWCRSTLLQGIEMPIWKLFRERATARGVASATPTSRFERLTH